MSEFLEFIQPEGGLCEIRAIRDGTVRQEFHHAPQDAHDVARGYSLNGWDAYYGVLPRTKPEGDSAVSITPVLWADLDAKTHGNKNQALRALLGHDVSPAVVIDSGHGYHAYWRLSAPVLFDHAKIVMMGIAKRLGGDHVYDRSRILRLPDTMNWKDPDNPVPVRVLRFDTTRLMRFSDFEKDMQVGLSMSQPRKAARRLDGSGATDMASLPDWLQTLIRDGAPQGTRSEQSFKVMCELARQGWSYPQVQEVFETEAIGEKYREKGTGERWLMRSWDKARSVA